MMHTLKSPVEKRTNLAGVSDVAESTLALSLSLSFLTRLASALTPYYTLHSSHVYRRQGDPVHPGALISLSAHTTRTADDTPKQLFDLIKQGLEGVSSSTLLLFCSACARKVPRVLVADFGPFNTPNPPHLPSSPSLARPPLRKQMDEKEKKDNMKKVNGIFEMRVKNSKGKEG